MAKQVTTMRDSNGNDIPLKYVSKYDKAKDRAVRKVLARFLHAREMLEKVVAPRAVCHWLSVTISSSSPSS